MKINTSIYSENKSKTIQKKKDKSKPDQKPSIKKEEKTYNIDIAVFDKKIDDSEMDIEYKFNEGKIAVFNVKSSSDEYFEKIYKDDNDLIRVYPLIKNILFPDKDLEVKDLKYIQEQDIIEVTISKYIV